MFVICCACTVGVGNLVLVDGDVVDASNRNRQLPALSSTLGRRKVDVMRERLLDINPEVNLTPHHCFLEPTTARQLAQQRCSYIVDCIDSIAPKVELLHAAIEFQQPIISSMGAGGKVDPCAVTVGHLCCVHICNDGLSSRQVLECGEITCTKAHMVPAIQFRANGLQVADISETHHDAFARVVRTRLRKRGVTSGLKVVFSSEPPAANSMVKTEQRYKRSYYGTMSYMPAVFGMHAAAFAIKCISAAEGPEPAHMESRQMLADRQDGVDRLPVGHMYDI